MWQELAVGIIVTLAALYLGAKYLPAGWRRALVHRLSRNGREAGPSAWLVKWLDTSGSCGSGGGSSTNSGGGCGGCGTCGTSDPAPPAGKGKIVKIHPRS